MSIRRFYVGSHAAFEAMISAVSVHKLRPVIDTMYPLDEAREAYRHLDSGAVVGKLVIGG